MKFFVLLWGIFLSLFPLTISVYFSKKSITDSFLWIIPAWFFLTFTKNILERYITYTFEEIENE